MSLSLTAWVLIILTVLYIPLWIYAWKSPKAAKYGLEKYGPTVKINTRLGTRLMDKCARFHRFWRGFGILSQIIAFILMVGILYIMVVGISRLPATLSASGIGIEYALAIPGLNPLLPFWYSLIALIIAMVLHELAHGMQTRTNGMRVKHTGVLHCVVPLGAFVEPNEEDVNKAPRRVKLDLYAAGIATNFIVGIIAFVLFANVMLGGISTAYGDNTAVYSETSDSPAYLASIPAGAIILTIDGADYDYQDTTATYLWNAGDVVTVVYMAADGEHTAQLRWGVYIESVISGSPADGKLAAGTIIAAINGHEFYSTTSFTAYMKATAPGETATVTLVASDGTTSTVDITLGTNGSVGYLGIRTTTSGMSFMTPNNLLKVATDPFYGQTSLSGYATGALKYLALPFNGFDPIPSSVQWWYGNQGEMFWMTAELLYWIFWLNIMLGVSNAIPAFPFDGGFIFLGWLDALMQKLGYKDKEKRERIANEVTSNLSVLMIFLYILVIVAVVI